MLEGRSSWKSSQEQRGHTHLTVDQTEAQNKEETGSRPQSQRGTGFIGPGWPPGPRLPQLWQQQPEEKP
jgi:hypothetical protein